MQFIQFYQQTSKQLVEPVIDSYALNFTNYQNKIQKEKNNNFISKKTRNLEQIKNDIRKYLIDNYIYIFQKNYIYKIFFERYNFFCKTFKKELGTLSEQIISSIDINEIKFKKNENEVFNFFNINNKINNDFNMNNNFENKYNNNNIKEKDLNISMMSNTILNNNHNEMNNAMNILNDNQYAMINFNTKNNNNINNMNFFNNNNINNNFVNINNNNFMNNNMNNEITMNLPSKSEVEMNFTPNK